MNFFEATINSIVSLIFALIPRRTPPIDVLKNTKLIAHRGVRDGGQEIENTLPAFALCLTNKIWGAELDVRITKDGIPVINHDPHLGRLFGHPEIIIEQTDFQIIRERVPQVPTLKEVVDLLGGRVHLMLEIKEDHSQNEKAVSAILKIVEHLKPITDYHLICMNPPYLNAFKTLPKEAFISVIWLNPGEIFRAGFELGHGGIAGHFLFFSQRRINELHKQNKGVGVGFLDSKNSLYRELNRGVNWIFTNTPLKLRKYLPD